MGNDLVTACVFCAGLLFGGELPPPAGYHAEVGYSYGTIARSYVPGPNREDLSDVTAKFVFGGLGSSRYPDGPLGAGSPAAEWRIRFALAPSHDEQEQTPATLSSVTATGTGRHENYALLLRLPLGQRDSFEAAANRRYARSTDLIKLSGENYVFSETRIISAERIDAAGGWRHRWNGFEAALSAGLVLINANNVTARAFYSAYIHYSMPRLALEGRARRGRWTLMASAERASGSVKVQEQNQPTFAERDSNPRATLEAYRLGLGYTAGQREFSLAGTYDRSRLPFVAFAVLGEEINAFETGFHPESQAHGMMWDLNIRRTLVPGFCLKTFLHAASGRETLTLTDPAGIQPTRQLEIRRFGSLGAGLSRAFGSPEFAFGLGTEIALPLGR